MVWDGLGLHIPCEKTTPPIIAISFLLLLEVSSPRAFDYHLQLWALVLLFQFLLLCDSLRRVYHLPIFYLA